MPETRTPARPAPGRLSRFPFYRQHDSSDCGPTCVRMIARWYGKRYSLEYLRRAASLDRQGATLLALGYTAESVGLRSLAVKTGFDELAAEAPLPCIAHWNQNHFVVVYRVHAGKVYVADPGEGTAVYTREEFLRGWGSTVADGRPQGVLLLLEPTPEFYEREEEGRGERDTGFRFLFSYVRGYGRLFAQVGLGMLVTSLLQLVFPFLAQAIVDYGIGNQDIGFVYLVLLAQLVLILSRTGVEFVRSRILFHVGTRVYVSIVSDFLRKVLRLPIAFFDARALGDLLQRVNDHQRIQQFLTTTTLTVVFSAFTLVVFSVVLAIYNALIFAVFAVGSLLYLLYVLLFLKRRKQLDYLRFGEQSRSHSALVDMLTGMQEIKLANAEQQKRWGWERVQARLFHVELRALALDQAQDGGAVFINEMKNVAVTFLAARLVIDGQLTLGMLLAVQYILGQLNAPLSQLVQFAHSAQDARISLERLGDIHGRPDEEEPAHRVAVLPDEHTLRLEGVTFGYGGPAAPPVLRDLTLEIPHGKVTAIVGPSGSGKTTLLKLLLKFYEPDHGEIRVGGTPLRSLSNRAWRDACGVVMQDGQLFSDTIAANVALGRELPVPARLRHALGVSNLCDFVEALPMAYNTKVGRDGIGMSQGQKQRMLIARAVYKNPSFLFFDEATSSLDANNERAITENLERFLEGRTAVIIAHRLSTVRNADQIVVLDRGRIVERGTHAELTARRGSYYELVKNQLELGN